MGWGESENFDKLDALCKSLSWIFDPCDIIKLQMSTELNEGVLESALSCLPRLSGLHVIGCPKVDYLSVLRLLSHTPLLESLSVTIPVRPWIFSLPCNWLIDYQECPSPSLPEFPTHTLHHLRHLAFDVRPASSIAPLSSILTLLTSCASPLSSFTIKAPELKSSSSRIFIKDLLKSYAHTLTKLSFYDCTVEFDSISDICTACVHLEQLNLSLPVKEIVSIYFSFIILVLTQVVIPTRLRLLLQHPLLILSAPLST